MVVRGAEEACRSAAALTAKPGTVEPVRLHRPQALHAPAGMSPAAWAAARGLAVCREGRRFYPDDEQILFQEALLHRELGDRASAEACFLRLLESNERPHFASVAEGLRGHKARHNLAIVYHEQGRLAEAEATVERGPGRTAGFHVVVVRTRRPVSWAGAPGRSRPGDRRARARGERLHQCRGSDPSALDVTSLEGSSRQRVTFWRKRSDGSRTQCTSGSSSVMRCCKKAKTGNGRKRRIRTVSRLDPNNAGVRNNLACCLRIKSSALAGCRRHCVSGSQVYWNIRRRDRGEWAAENSGNDWRQYSSRAE